MEDGKVVLVRVDMGEPELIAEKIPVIADSEKVIDAPIEIDGTTYPYDLRIYGKSTFVWSLWMMWRILRSKKQVRYLKNYKDFPKTDQYGICKSYR